MVILYCILGVVGGVPKIEGHVLQSHIASGDEGSGARVELWSFDKLRMNGMKQEGVINPAPV